MAATITRPDKEKPRTVTLAEAAWLTELSAKTVNATIDRGELGRASRAQSARAGARRLGPADVVYLVLRKELSDVLSATAKRELYDRLIEIVSRRGFALQSTDERGADYTIELAGGIIRVEMKRALRRLSKRWQALERAADVVVSD